VGVRKHFNVAVALAGLLAVSAAADAADLPVAPAPVYLPPAFTWTGFYVGGNVGVAFTQDHWSESLFLASMGSEASGGRVIGGGEAGFNYQVGWFVIGVEGDFDWGGNSMNAANSVFIPPVGNIQVLANETWVSTVAARFGLAADHWLFYGKAGGGWVGSKGFTVNNTTTGASVTGLGSATTGGWLVGGGIEWAVTDHWTVKLEYDYVRLTNQSFTIPGTAPFLAGDTFSNARANLQMAKVGVNYLFNWGSPVVARY
jgi:outer membrane immunogenic protein